MFRVLFCVLFFVLFCVFLFFVSFLVRCVWCHVSCVSYFAFFRIFFCRDVWCFGVSRYVLCCFVLRVFCVVLCCFVLVFVFRLSDYVTEKVYNGLLAGTLPVYWGADNVDDFVPKGSVVKVRHRNTELSLQSGEKQRCINTTTPRYFVGRFFNSRPIWVFCVLFFFF